MVPRSCTHRPYAAAIADVNGSTTFVCECCASWFIRMFFVDFLGLHKNAELRFEFYRLCNGVGRELLRWLIDLVWHNRCNSWTEKVRMTNGMNNAIVNDWFFFVNVQCLPQRQTELLNVVYFVDERAQERENMGEWDRKRWWIKIVFQFERNAKCQCNGGHVFPTFETLYRTDALRIARSFSRE